SNAEHLFQLLFSRDEDHARTGVLEHKLGLLSGERWINGYIHDSEQEASPVSDRPFKAVFRDEGHTITFSDSQLLELPRGVVNAAVQLARADIVPRASAFVSHDAREVAVDCSEEDVVERTQAVQGRTSIPLRSRLTTGSAAAPRSCSREPSTQAVASSSSAPNRHAAAILSETSRRISPEACPSRMISRIRSKYPLSSRWENSAKNLALWRSSVCSTTARLRLRLSSRRCRRARMRNFILGLDAGLSSSCASR